MELRKNTNTAAVLNWTPAPLRNSPPSSATSEDGWEDQGGEDGYCDGGGGDDEEEEEEEEAEELRAEDFERHMDENGIIGLREALEDVEHGEKGEEEDEGGGAWCVPTGACGSTTAYSEEERPPPAAVTKPSGGNGRGAKKRQTPENLSPFSPSRRLDPASSPSPLPSLPPPPRSYTYPHLLHFSSEELAQSVGIEAETLPDGDCLPESCCSSISISDSSSSSSISSRSRSRRLSHSSKPHRLPDGTSGGADPRHGVTMRPDPALKEEVMRHRRTEDKSPKSQTQRPDRPGPIQAKMREHAPRSYSSRPSDPPEGPSRNAWSLKGQAAPTKHQHAPSTSTGGRMSRMPKERPRKTTRRFAKNEPDVRREPPSFRTPDFSKVEPRVHFPKSGYEPPKSRSSPRVRLSPETTLIFKSPADIAKEILFSSADAPPSPPPSPSGPERNVTVAIVPEDLRCPHQATRLVEQLQEDYNTLLTRFAEAENTIDRLRLKAKVNLYSDPKRPDQSLWSRMTREGSKVMTLSFPQAQRAVMGSHSGNQNRQEETRRDSPAPPCSGSSSSSRGSCGSTQSPTKTLTKQANKFLQQVNIFDDLLSRGKLEPFERLKGISRLVQGLDLLERGYLAARDERTQLQRRVAEVGPFDPNRELEGLIFQCGTCVEELREMSEQVQYSSLAPPSPVPRPTSTSPMSEPPEPMSPPQSPVVLLPGETGAGVRMEMSSVGGQSGGELEGVEGFFLRPLGLDEQDFGSLMDSYQKLPAPAPDPAPAQTRGARRSPRGPGQPQDQGGTRPAGGARTRLSQRQSTSSDDDRAPATKLSNGQSDRLSHKAADQSQDQSLPVKSTRPSSQQQQQQQQQPTGLQAKGCKMGRYPSSSLTSLGESGEWETKSSRLGGGSRRVMSQDGIVSPETDSGFVGSDGTPAAVISPLHQRATESTSLPQTRIPRRQRVSLPLPLPPTTTTTTTTATSSSPPPPAPRAHSSSGGARPGNSGISWRPMRSSLQERRRDSAASASQRLAGPMPQAAAGSGTSDLGLESDPSHCVSEYDDEDEDEDEGRRQTAGSSGSRGGPLLSRHRDDSHNASVPGGQVMDHNVGEALQELQVEVSRLKERLERSLRTPRPAHPPLPTSAPGPPPGRPQPTRTFPAPPQPSTSTPRASAGRSRVDGGAAAGGGGGGGGRRRQGSAGTEGAQGGAEAGAGQTTWRRRASSAPTQRPGRGGADPERGHSAGRSPPSTGPSARHPDGPARTLTPDAQPQPGSWSGSSVLSDETHASARQLGHSARPRSELCATCGLSEPAGRVDSHTVHRRDPQHVPRGPQPAAGSEQGPRDPGLTAPAHSLLGSLGLVYWPPACHPALLFCSCALAKSDSQPPCVHAHSLGHATSEVRGHGEVSRYTGYPLVSKQRDSLSCSLNKAIRAARDMKLTSRRMARSMASGLHYQETLSQSCIY